jgi:hypothetical protein
LEKLRKFTDTIRSVAKQPKDKGAQQARQLGDRSDNSGTVAEGEQEGSGVDEAAQSYHGQVSVGADW